MPGKWIGLFAGQTDKHISTLTYKSNNEEQTSNNISSNQKLSFYVEILRKRLTVNVYFFSASTVAFAVPVQVSLAGIMPEGTGTWTKTECKAQKQRLL